MSSSTGDISVQIDLQKCPTMSIGEKIKEGAQKIESKSFACIYRVPEELRKLKESAYTPRLVSIGPLHFNDKHWKSSMQYTKMSYVNSLLGRLCPEWKMDELLKECLHEMEKALDDAKKYYADEVDDVLNAEMLLIDGCFVLELLYRCHLLRKSTDEKQGSNQKPAERQSTSNNQKHAEKQSRSNQKPSEKQNTSSNQNSVEKQSTSNNDPIFGSILMILNIQHDLLLLENQLPFSVLEKLFSLTLNCIPNPSSSPTNEPSPTTPTLRDYVLSFFGNIMNFSQGSDERDKKEGKIKYHHLLHILHNHYVPPKEEGVTEFMKESANEELHTQFDHMRSASHLDFAGIKFVGAGGKHPFFNIEFIQGKGLSRLYSRAKFKIPTLDIYDSTEPFLRNLIALEQCCPGVRSYFTSYAFLMDTLINSAGDVEVLVKDEVLRNYLGTDEEASDLFNKLCKEVVMGKFYFAEPCNNAANYSKRCWPLAKAHIRRRYFATPWTFIGFCFGLVAFVLSTTKDIRGFLNE